MLGGGRWEFVGQASKEEAGKEGTVSVFCMGPDAEGVTLKGLYYPLENGTLSAGFPLGVSNHFTAEKAEISVKHGSLLILWARKNGLPERQSHYGRAACPAEKGK